MNSAPSPPRSSAQRPVQLAPVGDARVLERCGIAEPGPCLAVRRKTAQRELARLQLRIRDCADRTIRKGRLVGERIESELRRARPRGEPSDHGRNFTGLVIDDRDASALQRIDAIEAQTQMKPA